MTKIVLAKKLTNDLLNRICQRAINKTPTATAIADGDNTITLTFTETLTDPEIEALTLYLPTYKVLIRID